MKKLLILFIVGALGYCGIEILSRGFTHWSMGMTGGACLIAIEAIYTRLTKVALWGRAALGAMAVTIAELCVGLIVNVWLGLNVWSYAGEPLNFMGQICAKYTAIWFVLCFIIMVGIHVIKTEIVRKRKISE